MLWELTSASNPVELERFRPPYGAYDKAVARWDDAVEQAAKRFARLHRTEPAGVTDTIDLAATSWGAVTSNRTYSAWLDRLTEEQKRFLEKPARVSIRLRGPAGTGKTLLLELKALRELYQARDDDRAIRILFATTAGQTRYKSTLHSVSLMSPATWATSKCSRFSRLPRRSSRQSGKVEGSSSSARTTCPERHCS